MTTPTSGPRSTVMIDSSSAVGLPGALAAFCRPASSSSSSHLGPHQGHLQASAAATCTPVEAVLASAFATGSFVGGLGSVADGSAFYSPAHIEGAIDGWHHPAAAAAAAAAAAGISGIGWTFDPRPIAGYAYGSASYGLDVRRKNATRESTSTLKAWLFEHIKNPYPTKGEKIMLAIITKMTLTQVSTWFANARRRLKKENRMQWPPRQRSGDEEDDDERNSTSDENDDAIEKNDCERRRSSAPSDCEPDEEENDIIVDTDCEDEDQGSSATGPRALPSPSMEQEPANKEAEASGHVSESTKSPDRNPPLTRMPLTPPLTTLPQRPLSPELDAGKPDPSSHNASSFTAANATSPELRGLPEDDAKTKPRIWSIVDTATSGRNPSRDQDSKQEVRLYSHVVPVRRPDGFQHWIPEVAFHPSMGMMSEPIHLGLAGSHVCGALTPGRGLVRRLSQTPYATFHGGELVCHRLNDQLRAPSKDTKSHFSTTPSHRNRSSVDV